jgi:TPR repeat protein
MKMKLRVHGSHGLRVLNAVLISIFLVVGAFVSANADDALSQADFSAAIGRLKTLAERGSHQAQYRLGIFYVEGKGVRQDYMEAMRWFRQAASQNDRDATYSMGVMYAAGFGVPKDEAKSAVWYRMAAEMGHSAAQVLTALNYATAKGVARDDSIAARWFYRAAQQGTVEAQIALASMYASGSGVQKDNIAAYAWATIAAAIANKKEIRDRAVQLQTVARDAMGLDEVVEAQEIVIAWRPKSERPAPPLPTTAGEQEGIQASLTLEGGEATVNWRFQRPPKAEISEISAEMDGKPLGTLTGAPYPRPDAKTSILILLDGSDPTRTAQFLNDKKTVLQIARQAKSNEEVDLAIYSNGFQLLLPSDSSVSALEHQVNELTPRSEPAHLGQALRTAIEMPSLSPTERRGIFVLTDGHSDDVIDTKSLIDSAKMSHTTLNFLISPSKRQIDPSFAALADATGGQVVTEPGLTSFLEAPFWLLNSGGTARVSFSLSPRLFWQSEPQIKVVFHNGAKELVLKAVKPVPVAGFRETTMLLANDRPLVFAGSSAAILILAGGMFFHISRRRKKAVAIDAINEGSSPRKILALLQNKADGAIYPIQSRIVQLGRASEAHIRLKDETVSRIHAILRQLKSGAFEIENRSSNGTFVNSQKVEIASLADGDLVTVGLTTLRYAQREPPEVAINVAPASQAKESTSPH